MRIVGVTTRTCSWLSFLTRAFVGHTRVLVDEVKAGIALARSPVCVGLAIHSRAILLACHAPAAGLFAVTEPVLATGALVFAWASVRADVTFAITIVF